MMWREINIFVLSVVTEVVLVPPRDFTLFDVFIKASFYPTTNELYLLGHLVQIGVRRKKKLWVTGWHM